MDQHPSRGHPSPNHPQAMKRTVHGNVGRNYGCEKAAKTRRISYYLNILVYKYILML